MPLTSQQQAEVSFWRDLKAQHGDNYAAFRHSELKDKTQHFPSFEKQKGFGLDLGCGLVSVLEKCGKPLLYCDPLIDEYKKIEELPDTYVQQLDSDSIPFDDNSFDWVFCVNVIDHTPDPEALIEEIKRVLKPGGILYFQVMFDPALYAPHYKIWRMPEVERYITLKLIDGEVMYHNEWSKSAYWGTFENNKNE